MITKEGWQESVHREREREREEEDKDRNKDTIALLSPLSSL